jgi:hypothetical protein
MLNILNDKFYGLFTILTCLTIYKIYFSENNYFDLWQLSIITITVTFYVFVFVIGVVFVINRLLLSFNEKKYVLRKTKFFFILFLIAFHSLSSYVYVKINDIGRLQTLFGVTFFHHETQASWAHPLFRHLAVKQLAKQYEFIKGTAFIEYMIVPRFKDEYLEPYFMYEEKKFWDKMERYVLPRIETIAEFDYSTIPYVKRFDIKVINIRHKQNKNNNIPFLNPSNDVSAWIKTL